MISRLTTSTDKPSSPTPYPSSHNTSTQLLPKINFISPLFLHNSPSISLACHLNIFFTNFLSHQCQSNYIIRASFLPGYLNSWLIFSKFYSYFPWKLGFYGICFGLGCFFLLPFLKIAFTITSSLSFEFLITCLIFGLIDDWLLTWNLFVLNMNW